MRFRMGLALGLGLGYVLGSKAGRERYEQIRELWSSLSASKPAQQISAEVRGAATRAGAAIEQKAADGVSKVTGFVRRDDQPPSRVPPG